MKQQSFKSTLLFTGLILLFFSSCTSQKVEKENITNISDEIFNSYWYQGLAEISSYDLKQVRYGEVRDGEAVMVFVTEDFLINQQVKKESNSEDAATSVLKLNQIRKFPTGVYDYSMMNSTFSNINQEKHNSPLKLSTSSQEWCGHSWMQLNKYISSYMLSSYSYFEKEGDYKSKLNFGIVEDGIWNQIRIKPEQIKEGETEIFPSTFYVRLNHIEPKYYKAIISKIKKSDTQSILKIEYKKLDRVLEIVYNSEAPYFITEWKETIRSKGKEMTTIAKRKGMILSPYWSKNSIQDSTLRKELNLKY